MPAAHAPLPAGFIDDRIPNRPLGVPCAPLGPTRLVRPKGRRRDWRVICILDGQRAALSGGLLDAGIWGQLSSAGLLAEFGVLERDPGRLMIESKRGLIPLALAEWCGAQWKASAISMLEAASALGQVGVGLASGRPECMMQFGGGRPVLASPGIMAPLGATDFGALRDEFARCFLVPLYYDSVGRSRTLRHLPASGDVHAPWLASPELAEAALEACHLNWTDIRDPAKLLSHIAAIPIYEEDTFWSRYDRDPVPLERTDTWPYKNHAVERILSSLRPASVLDLACNTGWYARLAARTDCRVVALDSDHTCVNRLFEAALDARFDLTAATSDIFRPVAIQGPGRDQNFTAGQRFESELTLALAITHHMVLAAPRLNFDQVADLLAWFSRRYLLTEFVSFEEPAHNPYPADSRVGCGEWYTLDNFQAALGRRFREVVLVPGPPGRRLVLAKK